MAVLALAVAGAWLAPAGYAAVGWAVGSAIGSMLQDPTKVQGAQQSLMDLRVSGSEYGQPIPYVRGAAAIAGQMWWNTDRRPTTTTTTTSSGGKGGGGVETSTSTTTYDMDCLIGLTDNEIIGIRRIWWGGDLIYTAADDADAESLAASVDSERWTRLTIYTGASDQLPDPTYEAAVGTANAPAYRGRSYVFIESLKLGQSGQVPNLVFEVVVDGDFVLRPIWLIGDTTASYEPRDPAYSNPLGSLAAGPTEFIAATQEIQQETPSFRLLVSPDGIAWTARDIGSAHIRIYSLCYGGGQYVAMAYNWSAGIVGALRSSDGLTWNWSSTGIVQAAGWTIVIYGGGQYVAMLGFSGSGGYRAMTSPDGITWTKRATPAPDSWNWLGIAYGAGIYVAVSINGMMTSPDGITWTTQGPLANAVTYAAGLFVAVRNATCYSSADGINWTQRTTPDKQWTAITYGGGLFVAVANGGTAAGSRSMSSPDGITWTAVETPADNEWHEIVYANDLFVATALTGSGNRAMAATIDATTMSIAPPAVSTVVSDLCVRAGLTTGQIDVTDLASITRTVACLPISQIAPARQALELLMSAYFFEITISDKLYFRPRGAASVASIPYLDLGATMGDEQPEPLALHRANNLELPAQIALTYINVDEDYQTDTQYSDRMVSAMAGTVEALQMALGLTPSEAKAIADTMMLDQVAGATSTTIALLGDYCRLEPTDTVTVTDADGVEISLRLVKKTDSYPLLTFDAVLDDVSVLTSTGVTSTDYTPSTAVAPAVNTEMELMDIPILQDADNNAGFYVATKGDGTTYPGSAVFSSADDIEYTRKATIEESAVFGTCTSTLGNWTGTRVVDETNTVTVNVGDGTLESSTRAAILNSLSTNAMLIGSELIQFITATLVSTGIYTLSGLLRGCRGTEWAMTGHAASERCVLLRAAGLRRVAMANNELGLARYYKGVTIGRAVSTATAEQFTDNAVGLKPFAPIDLRAARDTSNNITFTWQRRTRLSTRMIGTLGISVPLGEDSEAYEIDIYSDGTYTTVLRTITATSETASYTAAEQTTDGLTPGDTVYCHAYQLSAQIGRGYSLEQAA